MEKPDCFNKGTEKCCFNCSEFKKCKMSYCPDIANEPPCKDCWDKKGTTVEAFEIEIVETLSKRVTIHAKSSEEAREKAQELYRNQIIVLDDNNHIGTDFYTR